MFNYLISNKCYNYLKFIYRLINIYKSKESVENDELHPEVEQLGREDRPHEDVVSDSSNVIQK